MRESPDDLAQGPSRGRGLDGGGRPVEEDGAAREADGAGEAAVVTDAGVPRHADGAGEAAVVTDAGVPRHAGGAREAGIAGRRWADALGLWAIPEEIIAAAGESPWGFPPAIFERALSQARSALAEGGTPSQRRAMEALRSVRKSEASVLDVGAGAGAASLPLVPLARQVTAVDQSEEMLRLFAREAERTGVEHQEVHGSWPEVADSVDVADVVVCHHVAYNVADIGPFALALQERAGRRVVMELTARHPQSPTNPLWEYFHGLKRPSSPVAEDAVEALREVGIDPGVERSWRRGGLLAEEASDGEQVAFLRRRICLPRAREEELLRWLEAHPLERDSEIVTVWWDVRQK